MKEQMITYLFHAGNYATRLNLALLLLRLVAGVFMLTHGVGKFLKLIGNDPIRFADPLGVGITASLALTVFAEVFCSLLLIVGMATRFAVIPLLVTMLVAVFVVHANDGFGKQELPLLYALIYLVIGILGAGKLSIDNWLSRSIFKSRNSNP